MADRHTLHISKKNQFAEWMQAQGYMQVPTKNIWEEFRFVKKHPRKDTVIIYRRDRMKEHLVVQEKDAHLVCRFIRETRYGDA